MNTTVCKRNDNDDYAVKTTKYTVDINK